MQIRVLYFGVLREQMGKADATAELASGSTVTDLLRFLEPRTSNRAVDTIWQRLAVAVNREYATASQILQEGDEVALLPPVSGGCCAAGEHP